MKREPVVIVMSIIAALSVLFGAFVTSEEAMLVTIGGYGMMVVGAVTAGIQFYVRGEVTPNVSVVERVPGTPQKGALIVAGPANDLALEGETIRKVGEKPKAEVEAQALQQELNATSAELEEVKSNDSEVKADVVEVKAESVTVASPPSEGQTYFAPQGPATEEYVGTHRDDSDDPVMRWCTDCGREHFFSRDGEWADHPTEE